MGQRIRSREGYEAALAVLQEALAGEAGDLRLALVAADLFDYETAVFHCRYPEPMYDPTPTLHGLIGSEYRASIGRDGAWRFAGSEVEVVIHPSLTRWLNQLVRRGLVGLEEHGSAGFESYAHARRCLRWGWTDFTREGVLRQQAALRVVCRWETEHGSRDALHLIRRRAVTAAGAGAGAGAGR